MAKDNKTEKATPRRREKARKRGQITRSREVSSALAVLGVTLFLGWQAQDWGMQWRQWFSQWLDVATNGELTTGVPLMQTAAVAVLKWWIPAILLGWTVAVFGMVSQGGFVLASEPLTPKWARISPASNIKKLFSISSVSRFLKSMLPMSFLLYLCISIFARDWEQLIHAGGMGAGAVLSWAFGHAYEVAWKAGLVLLVWSGVDYLLQRLDFEKNLKMSKQDIRDEAKETEGSPLVKGKIRRLQREMRRKRMMQDVSRATVVITNPDEYAVALDYQPDTMAAPMVLAKGRNLLAQQIKQIARWNEIPIVENRPLAQALYKAAEVGQSIPIKLYATVAEILAFLYRTQSHMRTRAASAALEGQRLEA